MFTCINKFILGEGGVYLTLNMRLQKLVQLCLSLHCLFRYLGCIGQTHQHNTHVITTALNRKNNTEKKEVKTDVKKQTTVNICCLFL